MNSKLQLSVLDDSAQEAIRSELSRVLSSPVFRDAPQASRFLSFVVQAVLSGEAHNIKQYTIAVDAFGHTPDFDPQINPTMRTLAGRVRMMLERYYTQDGTRDAIRIEIPKRTYIPIFRANSIPQEHPQVGFSVGSSLTSIIDYGISVAVISFRNHPPDAGDVCAYNITESIVMGLVHFHEICVVGPLVEYNDRSVEPGDVGRKYHVRFVLQGRVKMLNDTLRVSAGLTDNRTGCTIWSQTYEHEVAASNLHEIEETIAQQIINALVDYSGFIPCLIRRESMKKRPIDLQIHEAICCQNLYMKIFTLDAHCAAVEALEYTTKADPANSGALAMLGNAYCCNELFNVIPESPTLEKCERLVLRAEAIEPECQMAHLTEAGVRFLQGQEDRCIAKLQLARSLNPFNGYAIHASGVLLSMMGHWEEGMRLWKKATYLNPNHTPFYFIVPFMDRYRQGDYEAAWNYAVRFNTPMFWDPLIRAATAAQLGLYAQAKAALKELLEMRPDFPSHARDMIRRIVYLDAHVELLLEGLGKAGLG